MSKWSLSVPHTSPSFIYTPSDQWQSNVDNTARSTHSSSASVALSFSGTGISLLGSVPDSCDFKLDSVTASGRKIPSTGALFELDDLDSGQHRLSMTCTLKPAETLDFRGALIFSTTSGNTAPVPMRYDNNNSSALAYSNGWSLASARGIPNSTVTIPYHTTSEQGSSVSFAFHAAAGIEIQGMTSADSGQYTVNFDGRDYGFNTTTSVLVPDDVLFFQTGLDPLKEYAITLTNSDSNLGVLSLNSVTVFEVPSTVQTSDPHPTEVTPKTSSKHSTGPLVGIIAGSVSALVLLSLFIFFLIVKRRKSAPSSHSRPIWGKLGSSKKGISQGQSHTPPTPFYGTVNHESYNTLPPGGGTVVGCGTSSDLFDPFASSPPSANQSRTDLVLPSAASVIVANDHTGATVMYWAPSDRFLAGVSNLERPQSVAYSSLSQTSPSVLQSEFPTSVTAPSTPPPSDRSPRSSSLRQLLPVSSPDLTNDRQSSRPPEPVRRTSLLKRPFIRLLPLLPVSRPPPSPASPVPEYPLQEMDAGRFESSFLTDSPIESSSQAHPPFPPPQYERGQWPSVHSPHNGQ
jgi:hypothetical protein